MPQKNTVEWHGDRVGWLYNYRPVVLLPDGGGDAGAAATDAQEDENQKANTSGESALQLFFIDHDGETFECPLKYKPYFFVAPAEGHEREVELGIAGAFGAQLDSVFLVAKEDLGMVNHLSGKKRNFLKLTFLNTSDLTAVRAKIDAAIQRHKDRENGGAAIGSSGLDFRGSVEDVFVDSVNGGSVVNVTAHGDGATAGSGDMASGEKLSWMRWVVDMREFDLKYFTRVAIDLEINVGVWYDVEHREGEIRVVRCDDSKYAPAVPRICAFDIETTKAPLKFPQPEVDQIYMISYMVDGRGFLIVNREIVSEDISDFEYTPRPEYEGHFECFNEADEKALLERWFSEMKLLKPLVYVTYNGDYFDFPFIQARAEFHGLSLRRELGFSMNSEGATLHPKCPHLDCFYWVKRDSYLPQGSQGLKAVTKAKLGYEPIEVDPEDMLPLARERPQMMASYSVSDAVSTFYLYMKYVHPFIFSLCTIIPMAGDDVLRKGSGTLCESLLCVQAYKKNVVFPNKQAQTFEKFVDGHLIDSETYIGGRVEALKSGVYRSDIPIKFQCVPEAFERLSQSLEEQLKFAIEVENNAKLEDITNYEEVLNDIRRKLFALRDNPNVIETPLIYHLDVGAMYPNIILTNRLQPPAMVTPEICAGCCYNTPDNANKCKRDMQWKWRGELFTASRHEFQRIKSQLETETFAAAAVAKADAAATTKKTYGNKRGNVLEGTTFEASQQRRAEYLRTKMRSGGGGGGYRRMTIEREKESRAALLAPSEDEASSSGSDAAEDGTKRFHKLKENTQFALLKKRMGEYSRKAYRRAHETKEVLKTHTVCQRENSFYVDTVRLFRDRRYYYKRELKRWKDNLDKASDPASIKEAKSRVVQMESLQLAHKCILNSFYGYVMRKGSRWYSMEMAGIVTYLGAGLIMMARQLVQQIGVTLELDTDGIWCCLPASFPENYTFKTTNPKKSVNISYPCVMLNKDVYDRYTNHQYQDLVDGKVGNYTIRSECSIAFEVDGPYKAMILPAAREEGKSIKKRYAVFHPDGRLAELKGFELKRRGELTLIKDFQSQVFSRFLDGTTLAEAFASAAKPANDALDMLYSKGEGFDDDEILAKLLESSSMTRRLSEYPESQKSLALTTARRIAEFLGPQMVKDKGLSCVFFISRMPLGKPVTERAIPFNIFKADGPVRAHFLRSWTGDSTITSETHIRDILDWEYYIQRFNSCLQKIITIPAALQHVANPVPRVQHPDWLIRAVNQRSARHKQMTLSEVSGWGKQPVIHPPVGDIEDVGGGRARRRAFIVDANEGGAETDSESAVSEYDSNHPPEDSDVMEDLEKARLQAEESEAISRAAKQALREFQSRFLNKLGGPLDRCAFEHPGFSVWLRESQQGWLDRVRLRRQLFNAAVPGAPLLPQQPQHALRQQQLSSVFVEKKAQAMSGAWHVLEVRDAPDRRCPCGVDVFALINQAPIVLRVQVERVIYVNLASDSTTAIFGEYEKFTRIVTASKILPRHMSATALVEVNVSEIADGGAALIDRLVHREDDVLGVFETHLTPSSIFISVAGAVCSVNASTHLRRMAQPGPHHSVPRDVFALSELVQHSVAGYLDASAPGQPLVGIRFAFLIHASSLADTRGFCGVFFADAGRAVIAVSVPPGAVRPSINLKNFAADAANAVGVSRDAVRLETVDFSYHSDMRAAMTAIDLELDTSLKGPLRQRVQLVVVQSILSTKELASSAFFPSLSSIATLRTQGALEDNRLITQFPLTWIRDVSRRAVQRYFAAGLWVDERRAVAIAASVPLCNIEHDPFITAWDVLFARALRQRHHVLWPGASPAATEEDVETRPTQAVCVGGHVSWTAEMSIAQVDIVAVLFSQIIQEGDDPKTLALIDRGIVSHFAILRHIVSELYGSAIRKDQRAAAMLVNFSRWLRCTMSGLYEPLLVSHVNVLVTRVLAALVKRVTQLGGRIVRADRRSVWIGTPKMQLAECAQFADYITHSLCDSAVLRHLSPVIVRFWSSVIVIDKEDYVGMAVDAAVRESSNSTGGPSDLRLHAFLSLISDYSDPLKNIMWSHLSKFLETIEIVKRTVEERLHADPTVTLATRYERYMDLVLEMIGDNIERQFQPDVIRQVSDMLDNRELHDVLTIDNRFVAPSSAGSEAARRLAALSPWVRVAVRFFKDLCHIVSLIPRCEPAARKSRNNCLRLCNIGSFAPEAHWEKPRREATIVRLICAFCNDAISLDLTVTGPHIWKCSSCANSIRKHAVESLLVRQCRSLLVADITSDRVCPKCRQTASSAVIAVCSCGGILKPKNEPPIDDVQQILTVARVHEMPWLEEVALHTLEYFGGAVPSTHRT